MIFCMSFLFVGCVGLSPDEREEWESELDGNETTDSDSESLAFDMYGTKVLYRPTSYDYNIGSGGTEENPNDYYGKYAWEILNALYGTYGISQNAMLTQMLPNFDIANLSYLYDTIRHQIDSVGIVTKEKVQGESPTALAQPIAFVGADLTSKWNWSFNYDWSEIPSALLNGANEIIGNHIYNTDQSDIEDLNNFLIDTYTETTYASKYQTIYLGTNQADDYDNFSDYVKALEYAIYSYALDLEPAQVLVTYASEGAKAYSVKINNIGVDEALENIITLFNSAGSYVGLTSRQANKLQDWILNNIIGNSVQDDITFYNEVTKVVDSEGNFIEYELSGSTTKSLGRDYETAVANIVSGVCKNVTIGSADSEGSGTIEDNFLASEIMEYAQDTFVIAGDENFPKESPNNNKYCIKPLEYQSVVFMLKEDTVIDGMYIALKYDADGDGTEDETWDESKYLDIIVELNFYSHKDNKVYTIGREQTRVYDGPFDPDSDNAPDMYEDRGNVYFYDYRAICKDEGLLKHLDDEERLVIGSFNTEIGNKALMTDVGTDGGYKKAPFVSTNPLVLVGTAPARRYYSLIEPSEGENLNGKTYITGCLNPQKFSGSDGCDYLEITYKVLKDHTSDTSKNFKFYTGISNIY